MLITLYGVNNIGKSTQAKLLCERLIEAGHKVYYLKYPIYDLAPSGTIINDYLRNSGAEKMSETELQTWFFLNRLEFEPQLKTLLEQYDFVIAEDYSETGIAWGSAKGADENWLTSLNSVLIREDKGILLTGERFLTAVESGHAHEENSELTDKCAEILLRRAQDRGFAIIEVVPGIENTFAKIWEEVMG